MMAIKYIIKQISGEPRYPKASLLKQMKAQIIDEFDNGYLLIEAKVRNQAIWLENGWKSFPR